MKKTLKGLTRILITTALLFSTTLYTAFAEADDQIITTLYNGVNIYMDGNLVHSKYANQNEVDVLSYKGTTYIPLNAVSKALEKQVFWDNETNSLYIGNVPSQDVKAVTVSTAEELIKAIGSNKRILLKPGVYDLSSIEHIDRPDGSVTWEPVYDGDELNIQNINNLTIEGMEEGKTEIRVAPRYAYIMNFKNVKNITIKNIVAGHEAREYECDAGVLAFKNSKHILISNSKLYGCGSVGLTLNGSNYVNVNDSTIYDCSLRAVAINNSTYVKFKESKLINNRAYSNIVNIFRSNYIVFDECTMSGNNNLGWSFMEADETPMILFNKCTISNNSKTKDSIYANDYMPFFDTNESNVYIKNSIIRNNKSDCLVKNKSDIVFDHCVIENNSFVDDEYKGNNK